MMSLLELEKVVLEVHLIRSKMYNILALDQSSKCSGYAIFRDGYLYQHGTFTVTDSDIGTRLFKIRTKVYELINDFNIDEVVFEDIYMDGQKINNVNTFKALAEVFGVIEELLTEMKIPHKAISSASWKSTCGIKKSNRDAEKKAAKEYVLKTYNFEDIKSQDACDAICIGTHYIKKNSQDFNWE